MKKIFYLLMVVCAIGLIAGCEAEKSKKTSSTVDISKVTIRFKEETAEVDNEKDVDKIYSVLKDKKLLEDKDNEEGKGWIYELSFGNDKDENVDKVYVLNDDTIKYNDELYTAKNLDLEYLDKVSGIDRK